MSKFFSFFRSVAELVVAMHEFSECLQELVEQLKLLRADLKEEQQHREAIYRLLMDTKVRQL